MNMPAFLRSTCLPCLLLAALTSAASPDDPAPTARAKELVTALFAGRYADFVAAGNDQVRTKLDEPLARTIVAQLQLQLGSFATVDSANHTTVGGMDSVSLVCRFERGACTLRVVLDSEHRMAGFWIDAVNARVPYAPPDYVDQDSFREHDVTVSAGTYDLPGKLCIPTGDNRFPALVLVHGSGPHDEDETIGPNKPFRDLAWGLASRGVAVLRYVKRTKAHPTSHAPADWTLEDETIADALAAVSLLREDPRIDPKRIFVLGHSLGGLAAPLIAERDRKLAGIGIMAGNSRSILDLLDEQLEYVANADGTYTEEEKQQVQQVRDATALIRAGQTAQVTAPILGVPAVYWERLHQAGHVEVAQRLSLPIFVIQGGRDYQVTRDDFALWQKSLSQNKSATFRLYEDLNHLFMTGTGRARPDEYGQLGHVAPAVITDLGEWIARH